MNYNVNSWMDHFIYQEYLRLFLGFFLALLQSLTVKTRELYGGRDVGQQDVQLQLQRLVHLLISCQLLN